MLFKKFVSLVLHSVYLLFILLVLASFTEPEIYVVPANYTAWLDWFSRHWALIALILSEIAALLPGKPKGLLQWFLLLGSKIASIRKQDLKIKLL